MNIYVDSFTNSLYMGRKASNKVRGYYFEFKTIYDLKLADNVVKAIEDFLNTEESKVLRNEKVVNLILPDHFIGFGTFDLPKMNRFKIKDVFTTRFRLHYPAFEKYHLTYYEYDRTSENIVYFYTVAYKPTIDQIKEMFKKREIKLTGINYFSNVLIHRYSDKKNSYPIATLVIGEQDSRLIISKKQLLVNISQFGYGEHVLLNEDNYLDSAYNNDNMAALKYCAFVKENYKKQLNTTDENINKADPNLALEHKKPKELRLLKEEQIKVYNLKNNIKKYYSMIMDILEYYSKTPWFLPIETIRIVANDEMYQKFIEYTQEYNSINLTRIDLKIKGMTEIEVKDCKLFSSTLKKKGLLGGIDWQKFFSLEIGKKSKKD